MVLPPGEGTKDLAHFGRLVDDILACGIERGTMLVALGGGVVGDITGFAAATLLRGIDFVQIPTTLLAQVDSSVGGKTAINTRRGKNLLGAFYQPRLVLADTDALATLAASRAARRLCRDRQIRADPRRRVLRLARTPRATRCATSSRSRCSRAVLTSCRMKAEIVAGDEREEGDRALLNFGHTFGHALEAETGFGDAAAAWRGGGARHGAGVRLRGAARASSPATDGDRVRRHLDRHGPADASSARVGLAGNAADRLIAHMGKDKKVRDGRITLILPHRIGDVFVMRDAPVDGIARFSRRGGLTLAGGSLALTQPGQRCSSSGASGR